MSIEENRNCGCNDNNMNDLNMVQNTIINMNLVEKLLKQKKKNQ